MIIDREREEQQLRDLLKETLDDYGSLILGSRESGIDNTTLICDFTADASEQGAQILTISYYDLRTTPARGPWAEAIRGYVALDYDPPPDWFGNYGSTGSLSSLSPASTTSSAWC